MYLAAGRPSTMRSLLMQFLTTVMICCEGGGAEAEGDDNAVRFQKMEIF